MSNSKTRAEQLAAAFLELNEEVTQACRECPDAAWQRMAANEERSVGVVFHHIAAAYKPVAEWAAQVAGGTAPEISYELVNKLNDGHAAQAANVSREETAAALEKGARAAAAIISAIADEALDKPSKGTMLGHEGWTAAAVVEHVMMGHARSHLKDILDAVG